MRWDGDYVQLLYHLHWRLSFPLHACTIFLGPNKHDYSYSGSDWWQCQSDKGSCLLPTEYRIRLRLDDRRLCSLWYKFYSQVISKISDSHFSQNSTIEKLKKVQVLRLRLSLTWRPEKCFPFKQTAGVGLATQCLVAWGLLVNLRSAAESSLSTVISDLQFVISWNSVSISY